LYRPQGEYVSPETKIAPSSNNVSDDSLGKLEVKTVTVNNGETGDRLIGVKRCGMYKEIIPGTCESHIVPYRKIALPRVWVREQSPWAI